MPSFKDEVISIVKSIPKGKVMSYGQIAACMGRPRAAREVGWALHAAGTSKDIDKTIPWWRVLNKDGIISIKGNWVATAEIQRALLEKDGIEVLKNFAVDMEQHRFNLKP